MQVKKHRQKYGEFIIEGEKMLQEAIATAQEVKVIVSKKGNLPIWLDRNAGIEIWEANEKDLRKASTMSTPPDVLAVVKMPDPEFPIFFGDSGWILVLDGIRDPGNMGTMLRTADWFGIKTVVCSANCVELYNPKTIQATMGSLFRLSVHFGDIVEIIGQSSLPVYAASMDGQSLKESGKPDSGFLVIGSESHGISEEVLACCSNKVLIPGMGGAESLNAAVACGILLWEFCGRTQS